ncbi:hypothetical protein CERZMDRAFT_94658 [Cercospora zeae-maydis SCOH1-5]|uniref:Uncharacterized protein n=1 Tax=Cercospora zeae-maydis SCOH1-5 TaxID=717836 RepID=A0A6A6FPM7_9PEZI|nr:hypothetical protein CERZMDRAFT_94658 [Cercospora zeae-maydis SCOH1-5]
MAPRRSYERSSGKIPLSVILNEVEPEPQPGGSRHEESRAYEPPSQARSYGSSPASSLGSPPSSYYTGATVPPPSASRNPPAAYPADKTPVVDHRPQQSAFHYGSMNDRRPRPPRPSYSEEQKFFIMYARIIRDNTWPEIEDRFEKLFGTRTKGGLTSVYYRVRREWGLMEVLKSGPGSYAADCREVEKRATNFSREFLSQIGYLQSMN